MGERVAGDENECPVRVGGGDRAEITVDLHHDLVVHGASVVGVVEEAVEELADGHDLLVWSMQSGSSHSV